MKIPRIEVKRDWVPNPEGIKGPLDSGVNKFIKQVFKEAERSEMNFDEIGRRSGVKGTVFSMLKNGKRTGVTLSTALKLARFFDLSLDRLK